VLDLPVAKSKQNIVIRVALVCVQVLTAHMSAVEREAFHSNLFGHVSRERRNGHLLSNVEDHVVTIIKRAAHAHICNSANQNKVIQLKGRL